MQIPEQSNWRQNVENLKDNLLLAFIGGTAFGVIGAAEGVSIPLAAAAGAGAAIWLGRSPDPNN
jgi:hypothetical protein